MSAQAALQVEDLTIQYGRVTAVRKVGFTLARGAAVSILGTNGAGKTTCVEGIAGLLPKTSGRVRFQGAAIEQLSASSVARSGIALVPQRRELFSNFTVQETLTVARRAAQGREPIANDEVYALFPRLSERTRSLAGNLSGGEQQMLAIARALITRPSLLILDELSSGLSQGVVSAVIDSLKTIRRSGLTLLVVEQNLEIAAALTDDCLVMASGEIAWRGPVQQAIHDEEIRNAFFS